MQNRYWKATISLSIVRNPNSHVNPNKIMKAVMIRARSFGVRACVVYFLELDFSENIMASSAAMLNSNVNATGTRNVT
jgi:hypothetical protein